MMKYRISILVFLACLMATSDLWAQYRFRITHLDTVGAFSYGFFAVDCSGDVCTAAGLRIDYSIPDGTDGRYKLMFYRSTNDGHTWNEQDPGLAATGAHSYFNIQRVQQIDARHAVAIGSLNYYPKGNRIVLKTSNGGATWDNQIDTALSGDASYCSIHFSDSMTGIFTWNNRLFTTHDGGAQWTEASFLPRNDVWDGHSDGGNAFRTRSDWDANNVIYRTSDDWNLVDSALFMPYRLNQIGDTTISELAYLGADTILAAAILQDTVHSPYPSNLQLFKSTDAGFHWARIDFPDTINANSPTISSLRSNVAFLGGCSSLSWKNIIVSRDHGMSWQIDTLIPADNIYPPKWPIYIPSIATTADGNAVAVVENSHGALTYSYLARIEKANMGVDRPVILPQEMALSPNPASSILTVESSSASLMVFDVLGRVCRCPQSGKSLDISKLPAAMYFVSDGKQRASFVKE